MSKKEERNYTRKKIVEYALQIARLKTMGAYLDSDDRTVTPCMSDVKNLVEAFQMRLNGEAKLLLSQLTIGGENDE